MCDLHFESFNWQVETAPTVSFSSKFARIESEDFKIISKKRNLKLFESNKIEKHSFLKNEKRNVEKNEKKNENFEKKR